ncbi:DUF2268 domain-containing putative Zn-dependent protease [Neobacillus sp. YIM B06451]|uniref:DUF2268 domain-containing putative Zn-dependent protease n=1 Tax=Neobacillus sp. YIM B06451 TaxID=3070994 RepID=UPI00292F1044|nr:DUF2268 domain-containing putative Zn-dependent protease [Neobacillus sp. YIM B06451]
MTKYLKVIRVFVLIISILSLTSCIQTEKAKNNLPDSNKEQDIESIVVTFEHQQTHQKFKIVNAYKLFYSYVEKAKSNNNDSKAEIYQEEVIKPIYNDCFENGEYLHMADQVLNVAPERFTEIELLSEKIENENMENSIKEVLVKSSDSIPSNIKTTVCVFPSTNVSPLMVTVGAGKIIVLYNRYFTDEMLKAGIAHEYHHSVWAEKHLKKDALTTVLDNLVFEGKAVMFEKLIYPEINFTPVDFNYYKDYWSKVAIDLEKFDGKRSLEIIMGGKDLPRFYGYSEGYKMVKSYLDLNPNLSPEEWTAISSKEIFEKGKYQENYK